jgi:DNA-binding LytR/AlgR family response regulator
MNRIEKLKCIIVDDEPIARKIISNFLNQIVFLENVGEYKNAMDALEAIDNNEGIDIIFLDINLPNLNGLSLAKVIKDKVNIIFTTAYKDFAVESYEVNAVDYLVKPFLFERFATAVFKAADRIFDSKLPVDNENTESKVKMKTNDLTNNQENDEGSKIFIKSNGITIPVLLKNIVYCVAMKNYTKIVLENGKQLNSLTSFSKMESDLKVKDQVFLRIHSSFIVSQLHVLGLRSKSVVLSKNELPIGSFYKELLLQKMGIKRV